MSEDTYIREAFEETVKDAVQAEDSQIFLCLYAEIPFYGGPEEGGWWGADWELISHKRYPTEEQAQAALKKVTSLATSLSQNAHRQYGEQCLRDMDWHRQGASPAFVVGGGMQRPRDLRYLADMVA